MFLSFYHLFIQEFIVQDVIKLLFEVIQNLNSDQKNIVQAIGFGTILELSCTAFPHDVFNWLAVHMDSTTGTIDLPNGFSFTITKECVPFFSSTETVSKINIEIHGTESIPSVYELADLIQNGLSGSAFAKAFSLLVNTAILCPTDTIFPSVKYYQAIDDDSIIKDFDWCSYALQWLLICVYNYKLDGYSGNCGGCGLIPVV
jgi:hypothetical protein